MILGVDLELEIYEYPASRISIYIPIELTLHFMTSSSNKMNHVHYYIYNISTMLGWKATNISMSEIRVMHN